MVFPWKLKHGHAMNYNAQNVGHILTGREYDYKYLIYLFVYVYTHIYIVNVLAKVRLIFWNEYWNITVALTILFDF